MLRSPDSDDPATPSTATPSEPTVEDACGDDPGFMCEWVFEATDGNETASQLARWFIDQPLTILLTLVVAWIVARIARRATDRVVKQTISSKRSLGRRSLETLGLDTPDLLVGDRDKAEARAARAESRAESISSVLGSTVTVLIWTIAIFIVLSELGVNLGPLIASAGIAGVALGFGAQSLVKDCITGLFILIEDQYGLGDVVDLGEAVGVVEEIALRTTVVRSIDGTVWHVPNGEIVRVGNMSQLWSMALVDVDVAYDADLDHAQSVVLATSETLCAEPDWAEKVVEDPQLLGVERLGADGVTIRLVVKCSPGTQWALQRQLRQRIKSALDDAGIEIPFPQRTIWVRRDDAEDPATVDG